MLGIMQVCGFAQIPMVGLVVEHFHFSQSEHFNGAEKK